MPRNIRVVLALAVALAGVSACGQSDPRKMPAPQVGVVTVQAAPVTLTAELPGRTVPYAISDVRPQVSGIVVARLFTEGAEVKAGQVLYQIDPKPYRAAYDNAKASLDSARANAATTTAKATRYATLLKDNAIAQQTYDDAKAAADQAVAAVNQAKAALETARINLNYTRVTAPITGRIGISTVTQGALVTAEQTAALSTIQTLDPIYVDIAQSSTQLLALKQRVAHGQIDPTKPLEADVSLRLDDGTLYPIKGRLELTDVTVDPNTGAVTLRAIFPNPNHILLPGMFVRAVVAEGVDPKGILAPQQGIVRDAKGQATAFVVGSDNKVSVHDLTLSQAVGNQWLVSGGLKSGDRLVVEGTMSIQPGMAVMPVAAKLPRYDAAAISGEEP